VGGDFEEEGAVPASVNNLISRRLAQRQSTEDEGAGMEGNGLLATLPLVADHLDGFKLLDDLLGDANSRKD
jgi:hypothetical protein